MDIQKIAKQNFAKWAEALQTKDPLKVAELYSMDATFLPTISPKFKRGTSEVEEYFKHFLEKNPFGKIMEEEIRPLGENDYLHSGMYDFEIGKIGDRGVINARFSFIWRKDLGGKWKIIHHHSSAKPQES